MIDWARFGGSQLKIERRDQYQYQGKVKAVKVDEVNLQVYLTFFWWARNEAYPYGTSWIKSTSMDQEMTFRFEEREGEVHLLSDIEGETVDLIHPVSKDFLTADLIMGLER